MQLLSGAKWCWRWLLLLPIIILIASFVPAKNARAQATSPNSYTIQECDQVKESDLRDELNRITQTVFTEEQGGLSVAAIVDRNWNALNLDASVDKAIEAAAERVMEETGYWDRFISGWSPEKAEELTMEVATYAFDSPDFREAFDLLSLNISDDVVAEIRLMTAKSASSALLCVQTFIGDSISPTMAAVLEDQIQTRLDEIRSGPDANVSWLDIAEANPVLLSGVGVIIGTQIAKSLGKALAGKIAGQIVKRILTRLVTGAIPLVGTLIGAALIAWDLFNARQGSLPQIRDSLQEAEMKRKIRAQVAEEVGQELRVELPQLARTVSNDVYSHWQEFRGKYSRVLDLAQNDTRFQSILDNTRVEMVKKLADLVALAEEKLGQEGLLAMIDKGQFERILALPDEAIEIFLVTGDPEVVTAWADLAGDLVIRAVELELYRVASATDFRDRADLETVLALEDATLIQKLMLLDPKERDTLLGLTSTHIIQVLHDLTEEDLSWLASKFLTDLTPQQRNMVVDRILSVPEVKPELKAEPVRRALLESREFELTLNYIIQRTKEVPWIGKVTQMLAAIGPVLAGDFPGALFWRYDGMVLGNVALIAVGLIALVILWRRVSPFRRQDVNVTVVLPESRGRDETDASIKKIDSRGG